MKNAKSIQRKLNKKAKSGGKVYLPAGEYKIHEPLIMNTPSTTLEGEAWACNVDPNGVFESPFGTKLKLQDKSFPAIVMGKSNVLSGTAVKNIGVQGDIEGMDTRGLFDNDNVSASAGLFFENMRADQCEFSKISCCGLSTAICAKGDCFIDACTFEKINADGCYIGVYFAPKLSVYTHFRQFIVADTPSYGFYFDGTDRWLEGVDISDMICVRNCGAGAFKDEDPAAIYFKNVSNCIIRDNLIADAGTFWYYPPDATKNEDHQIQKTPAIGIKIIGHRNRICNNKIMCSSRESILIEGDRNILMSNSVDGDVIICGNENSVHDLVFATDTGRLILKGEAAHSTEIFGVDEARIVRV